jgi:hypothetical protein
MPERERVHPSRVVEWALAIIDEETQAWAAQRKADVKTTAVEADKPAPQ